MGRYRIDVAEGIRRTVHLSAEEAARQLGVSPQTVRRRRRELGHDVRTQQQRKPGTGWR